MDGRVRYRFSGRRKDPRHDGPMVTTDSPFGDGLPTTLAEGASDRVALRRQQLAKCTIRPARRRSHLNFQGLQLWFALRLSIRTWAEGAIFPGNEPSFTRSSSP